MLRNREEFFGFFFLTSSSIGMAREAQEYFSLGVTFKLDVNDSEWILV